MYNIIGLLNWCTTSHKVEYQKIYFEVWLPARLCSSE